MYCSKLQKKNFLTGKALTRGRTDHVSNTFLPVIVNFDLDLDLRT